MEYDIIGDIHGQYDHLVALLSKLGYRQIGGTWRQPDRKAIFLGDLIDRGPSQVATVQLVRRMVDAGSAECILGNHEYNAILWATPDHLAPGRYLRDHDRPGNRAQHQAFLAEVEGNSLHQELITWFKTLPLWLDKGDMRVIHACWHQPTLDWLTPRLKPDNTLGDDFILEAGRYATPSFVAVELLCKGMEVDLPQGIVIEDADGHFWPKVRVKWWQHSPGSWPDMVLAPESICARLPSEPLRDQRLQKYHGPPLFFGHYWFTGRPVMLNEKIACLDYGAAKGGPLVAYRWRGESTLRQGHFAWIK